MAQAHLALLGLGNVGRAFARYVQQASDKNFITIRAAADSTGGLFIDSAHMLDRLLAHKESGRSVREFSPSQTLSNGREFIKSLSAEAVSAVVETLPTNITDGQPALDLITVALAEGINVVTADKGPLVHGFDALNEAASRSGARLGFSGTTGVRVPDEVAGSRVIGIRGVLNGTTNYILTEMQERSLTFEQALANAQAEGIAEPDPSLDIQGWDTASKILILAKALMGTDARLAEVSRIGIGPETETLFQSAKQRGGVVRLVGRARIWQGRVRVSVAPKIILPGSSLYSVAGTSKAALFDTEDKGEVAAFSRSGRDAISQTILDDLMKLID